METGLLEIRELTSYFQETSLNRAGFKLLKELVGDLHVIAFLINVGAKSAS
jgi:hypothetical protein